MSFFLYELSIILILENYIIQDVRREFSIFILPVPEQGRQGCCICWIMGPNWRIVTFIPRPWQLEHVFNLVAPFPKQYKHCFLRVNFRFLVVPSYNSLSVKGIFFIHWRRRFGRLNPGNPPPKNILKMLEASICWGAPSMP